MAHELGLDLRGSPWEPQRVRQWKAGLGGRPGLVWGSVLNAHLE